MCKKAKNKKTSVPRDINIFKCSLGELNLMTRTVQDIKKYNRKEKHKNKGF